MEGLVLFVIICGALMGLSYLLPKPKCPDCKTGKLHQHDVHNSDRWGNGMNIYKCDNCGKEWC